MSCTAISDKHLAVDLDTGLFQAVGELAVGQATMTRMQR